MEKAANLATAECSDSTGKPVCIGTLTTFAWNAAGHFRPAALAIVRPLIACAGFIGVGKMKEISSSVVSGQSSRWRHANLNSLSLARRCLYSSVSSSLELFVKALAIAWFAVWALSPRMSFGQRPAAPAEVEAKAQENATAQSSAATPMVAHPLDAADLNAFFDGIIPLQMERSDVAGATVLVMKDGKPLLLKGYGYADAKQKKPVDPTSTIFRLASISKLFTWVSVMQLEEQGKVDLDADINSYLDFQIRPAFGKPITLRNLMTHTAGFEEQVREIIVVSPKKSPALRDFLIDNQPRRIFPPGVVPAYSNYGVGLAGYIVERVSGEPFERYVAEHVFAPLGMVHSTFYQPPEKELESLPSQGYGGNTLKPPIGFEIFNPSGAGGISSTAFDMGRFGQALLNGGELDRKRILKPETLKAMFTPQFRANDQMPPLCMGFYETWRNDLRWIGHGGDLIAFHSFFAVEPSQKLVLFVSFNSAASAGKARPELVTMFADRYFPSGNTPQFVTATPSELKSIEGTYQPTRRTESTKLKFDGLTSQRTASLDKGGDLQLEDLKDLRGHTIKWKPIGKDLFQEVDGQRKLFAIRDGQGEVIRLAYDFPGAQSERVRWYENKKFVSVALGGSCTVLLAVVVATLIRFLRRLLFRKRPKLAPQPGTVWLPFSTKFAAWIWFALIATMVTVITSFGDESLPPTRAWDKYFYLVNVVTAISIFFSIIAILSGLRVWLRANLRTITKVKFSLVALACLLLTWFAIHWNIIGPASRL
jgi:CubicO group peptidase (beta-lactamase class C family)